MHSQEKMAWYTLAVILLTLAAYFTLLILTRNPAGSQAAFALSALLAFGGLYAIGKKGKIAGDEHDQLITLKAGRAAFSVFWLYFIAYGLLSMRLGDYSDTMPRYLMSTLIWTGMCVWLGAQAVAILIYYHADTTEKLTWTDRIKRTGSLRLTGLMMLGIFLFVATPFSLMMIFVGQDDLLPGFVYMICGSFAFAYVLERVILERIVPEKQKLQLMKATRAGTIALLVAALAGSVVVWSVEIYYPVVELWVIIPRVVFFVLVAGILSLALSLIRYGGSERNVSSPSSREATNV